MLSELLVFSQNQLQSTIPEWIAEWTNLQHLALDGNQFYGTIPSSIASLQNLEHLELQENPQLRAMHGFAPQACFYTSIRCEL